MKSLNAKQAEMIESRFTVKQYKMGRMNFSADLGCLHEDGVEDDRRTDFNLVAEAGDVVHVTVLPNDMELIHDIAEDGSYWYCTTVLNPHLYTEIPQEEWNNGN